MWRRPHKTNRIIHGARNYRTSVVVSVILILTLVMLLLHRNNGKPISSFGLLKLKWDSFHSSVEFRPSMAFMNHTDVIWQIPDSPKGVLFLAHGCHGRAANFWDRSLGCPICVGLPEERLIVLQALSRKFAVITISSLGQCWTFGNEMRNVRGILSWWLTKNGLEKLPLMALGASSGGYFVSALAKEMKFKSITLMIAEGVFHSKGVPVGYPPTLFVHMPKDNVRAKMVEINMEALKLKGVPVKEIRCLDFPLTPNFLSDRIPGLDQTVSVKLFEILRGNGFVDEKGYMKNDGRAIPWRKALEEKESSSEKFEWDDHIQEELNLAFGYHEMTSLHMDDILEWFEYHMR